MKRWIPLIAILAATNLSAVTKNKPFQELNFSKGLDSYHNPQSLPDGYVQDANNVLFDDKTPVDKRSGYTVAWSTKSYSYTGLWSYTDQTNTTWQIARSSDQLTASNLNGSIIFIASVSVNNTVGETNAFGNAYFVDQTQGVYFWNGSTTTYVSSSPQGSIITQFHNRLWVTGLAVPNGNQLYGSKYYDGTTWTTGLNPTDPVQLSIGLQDNFDNTTAEYVYLDTLYVFKHYSVFALYGFDQTSFQISQLTQECGCIDGGSIQTYNSGLKFMSLRGVEDFNGYTCKRISDPIKNKVDPAIQIGGFSQQSWVQQYQSDFNSGTINPKNSISIPANFVTLTSTSSTGSDLNLFNVSGASGTWGTSGSGITLSTQSTSGEFVYAQINSSSGTLYSPSIRIHAQVQVGPTSLPQPSVISIMLTNKEQTLGWGVGDSYNPGSSDIFGGNLAIGSNGTVATSQVFNSIYQDTSTLVDMELEASSTGYLKLYLSGSLVSTGNSTVQITTPSYVVINASDFRNVIPINPLWTIHNFQVTSDSGSFTSQIHNIGSITSWGNFAVQENTNGGNILFSLCSSTNSNMGFPTSCTSQTPNAQISSSTGTFVQWSSTFTISLATQTPTLQSVTVQWFTGNRATPMSSTVWDNRYWLSLTTNTADTSNDSVVVLNQNMAWTSFDIHAGAFTQYKNSLYHADSQSTGNIYLDNQGFADNGSPINAYIRTRTFSLGDFASDDYLYAVYPSALNTGSCTMSLSYRMDGGGNNYLLGSPLLSEFGTLSAVRLPFPVDSAHQDFGQTIDFFVGTDDTSCDWQFYGLEGLYKSRPVQ